LSFRVDAKAHCWNSREGQSVTPAGGERIATGIAAATPKAVLAGVGVVALVIAFTQAKTYWLMYGLVTFSLVLLLATPGHVGFEAEERGFQILMGIGLLVVGLEIIHALAAWVAKRDPQPELAA
jgi:hypothetical protein